MHVALNVGARPCTSHTYTAYGLSVDSSFPVPELRPASPGIADITFCYGDVPESLPEPSSFGVAWQSGPDQLLLSVESVARYLVVGNHEIRIEPLPGSRDADVRVFLLGSVFGALLHGRELLVLHASAIETPRGAVLFSGRTGVGKSTLLAAFLQRGYRMIADDKAAIRVDDHGVAVTLPGYPLVRLTRAAADALRYPVSASQLRSSLDKYVTPVDDLCDTPMPVHAVYALRAHNQPLMSLEPLERVDAFNLLNAATYRRRFLQASARRSHFQVLGAVARQVRVARVTRPDDVVDVERLRARIEEDFSR